MRCENTIGAVEAGSRCLTQRSFGDRKLQAKPVLPWPLHRAPAGSTLLQGERGVQCQRVTISLLAGGRRDRGYVCLFQTTMYHAVPETIALSQLSYGYTILYLNT